jgi:hypothetical protein
MSTAYKIDVKWAYDPRVSDVIEGPVGSAVAKIRELEAYYFYMNQLGQDLGWDRPEDNGGVVPRKLGLIAQELMAVEPSLVRPMTWLGDLEEEYYWVDYDALYGLLIDAVNELNTRADAIKTRLGMPIEEQYANTMNADPSTYNIVYTDLSVTPTNGIEGSQSVWTLTAQNVPLGLKVGFKLSGNCNWDDITTNGKLMKYDSNNVQFQEAGHDPDVDGWAIGFFEFEEGSNTATFTIDYVNDATIEGTETITMTLTGQDNYMGTFTPLTATANVSDS